MAGKTKEKIGKEDVGELPGLGTNGKEGTGIALIPPSSLISVRPLSEAEKAFLEDADETPSGPTKLPTIAVNHKDAEFVMPDGQTIEGTVGVTGFIIAHFTTRTYYASGFDPKAQKMPPDCRSSDCITPDADVLKKQNPDCVSCAHNAFGSAKVGKGKACKEYIRLFLVNPEFGDPPIAMLTLPPSAISKFYGGAMVIGGKRGYIDQLKSKHRAWQIIYTRITLAKDSEDAIHCVPSFEMGGVANLEVARALAQLNNQFVSVIKAARREVVKDDEPKHPDGDAKE